MAAEETKKAAVETLAAKPVAEKQTNCLGCNKPIRRLRSYYRNGKFFCTKKCWKVMLSKAKEEKK